MIFLTSLINTQIIDDEFYIININNITLRVPISWYNNGIKLTWDMIDINERLQQGIVGSLQDFF